MLADADIAIIRAGPVGLAATDASERGLSPIVVEQGPEAGHGVRRWGHVAMFSRWRPNVDAAAARLLAATGCCGSSKAAVAASRSAAGAACCG